jgi:hypothetical protein
MAKFIADGWTGKLPVPSFCPKCFHMLDAATNMEGPEKPEPGDYTVCIRCASVLRWNPDMQLELSSLEDIPMHSRLRFAKVVQGIKTIPWETPPKQ